MTNDISDNGPAANGAVRQSHDDGDGDRPLRERVHLLAADDLLVEAGMHPPRDYLTLCAQVMTDLDLPHATCPDDECDCELRYCPMCIQHALGWNAEIEDEMQAPGWTARAGSDGQLDTPSGKPSSGSTKSAWPGSGSPTPATPPAGAARRSRGSERDHAGVACCKVWGDLGAEALRDQHVGQGGGVDSGRRGDAPDASRVPAQERP